MSEENEGWKRVPNCQRDRRFLVALQHTKAQQSLLTYLLQRPFHPLLTVDRAKKKKLFTFTDL